MRVYAESDHILRFTAFGAYRSLKLTRQAWSSSTIPLGARRNYLSAVLKRSGYGKELSSLGLEEFVNKKLIVVPNVQS